MKPGGQKAKSGAHEREVAKLFTHFYYPDHDGEFRRVPLSGGWDKRTAPGDIIALKYVRKDSDEMVIDKSFPFSVECKNWSASNLNHFFSGLYKKESELFGWMRQAVEDIRKTELMPLVVFKLSFGNNVAMLRSGDFYKISLLFGIPTKDWFELKHIGADTVVKTKMVLILFSNFLSWVDWEVYKIGEKHKYIRSLIKKEKG